MTASEYEYNQQKERNRSKRPHDSKFIQQKLPVSHPVLNTTTVLPALFLAALIFIPMGIGIWMFSEQVGEVIINYTDCHSTQDNARTCDDAIKNRNVTGMNNKVIEDCTCEIDFTVEKPLEGAVYIYYALTNFYYQNHRKYYDSKDYNQLRGKIGSPESPAKPDGRCGNYTFVCWNDTEIEKDKCKNKSIIFPCGAVANSMFNDVITLYHTDPVLFPDVKKGENLVPLIRTGMAKESDLKKYQHSQYFNDPGHQIWKQFIKPPAWKKDVWQLDVSNMSNNGVQNEDFIIWMSVSAFPNFRKLYRVVNTTEEPYIEGLPSGNYTLKIDYAYDVTSFKGTKSIVLTTTSMTGGKNPFLAIAFMSVGGICLFLTVIFCIIHVRTLNSVWTIKED